MCGLLSIPHSVTEYDDEVKATLKCENTLNTLAQEKDKETADDLAELVAG